MDIKMYAIVVPVEISVSTEYSDEYYETTENDDNYELFRFSNIDAATEALNWVRRDISNAAYNYGTGACLLDFGVYYNTSNPFDSKVRIEEVIYKVPDTFDRNKYDENGSLDESYLPMVLIFKINNGKFEFSVTSEHVSYNENGKPERPSEPGEKGWKCSENSEILYVVTNCKGGELKDYVTEDIFEEIQKNGSENMKKFFREFYEALRK